MVSCGVRGCVRRPRPPVIRVVKVLNTTLALSLSLSLTRAPAPGGPLELEFVGLALQIATIVESFFFLECVPGCPLEFLSLALRCGAQASCFDALAVKKKKVCMHTWQEDTRQRRAATGNKEDAMLL